MSAIIGKSGRFTVSVGDGGTVYLTIEDGEVVDDSGAFNALSTFNVGSSEWHMPPASALELAALLEKAAVHREPDPRTRLEAAQDEIARLEHALGELAEQLQGTPPEEP
jgi:hypothetical protein